MTHPHKLLLHKGLSSTNNTSSISTPSFCQQKGEMATVPPTQYPSTQFVESAGTALINPDTNQICILRYGSDKQYVLPKGRRNINENRHTAALRETQEETGYKSRLLPITLQSWQPPEDDDGGFIGAPVKHEGVTEPFMVAHRMLKKDVLKIVWWYLAIVEEGAEIGKAEKQFERVWVGLEEAQGLLTFESDREVVKKAAEIWKATYPNQS